MAYYRGWLAWQACRLRPRALVVSDVWTPRYNIPQNLDHQPAPPLAKLRRAEIAALFIERHGIETLNMAGPSELKPPKRHDYAQAVIGKLLCLMDWHPSLD